MKKLDFCDLSEKNCKACEGQVSKLLLSEAQGMLGKLSGWELNSNKNEISRIFTFKNYYKTIAFVNAIAWMAHKEGHHPDLQVSYNKCIVNYTTHSIGGLSENDFICAAKATNIFQQGPD